MVYILESSPKSPYWLLPKDECVFSFQKMYVAFVSSWTVLADADLGSCDTDIATPPSSVTSSNKFSTSTSASNTSG